MSEELKGKLKAYNQKKESEHNKLRAVKFLNQISSLEFIDWAEDISMQKIFEKIKDTFLIETIPEFTLQENSSQEDLTLWLRNCLKELELNKEVYLLLPDYPNTPYCRIKIITPDDWLPVLWNLSNSHWFSMVNTNKNCVLTFNETEYYHQAFVRNL